MFPPTTVAKKKVVIYLNRKGGVGKSTMAVHSAVGLARRGHRIGLVDTDSQGHAGMMLGLPEADGLHGVLIDKKPLADFVMEAPVEPAADKPGALYVLPSSVNTYKIPYMLQADEEFLFLETMEDFAAQYQLDTIIVDTAPTMSLFDGAIHLAADGYVFVTEAEAASMDGIMTALDQMNRFAMKRRRFMARDAEVLGIIPNKLRKDTGVHQYNLELLREKFGALIWSPVVLRTLWAEAGNMKQTVFSYAKSKPAANDAWRIVDHLEVALWPQTDATL